MRLITNLLAREVSWGRILLSLNCTFNINNSKSDVRFQRLLMLISDGFRRLR
nr:MAG TPA: hypothetical protein [Caudoviricetes sp.]